MEQSTQIRTDYTVFNATRSSRGRPSRVGGSKARPSKLYELSCTSACSTPRPSKLVACGFQAWGDASAINLKDGLTD